MLELYFNFSGGKKKNIVESHKRRRRFHPLRNLRRIFRRRTLAHADAIRPIVQQHQNYYHRNDGKLLTAHRLRPIPKVMFFFYDFNVHFNWCSFCWLFMLFINKIH